MPAQSDTTNSRSFFSTLAIADVERIHTQVISWLLTHCSTYTKQQKSFLICSLFDTDEQIFQNIQCFTEFKHIDLLVVADDFIGAIENKLKSDQRPKQLEDYWDALKEIRATHFPDVHLVKAVFLALTNEPSGHPSWIAKSYKDLLHALETLPTKVDEKVDVDTVIVIEYLDTLKTLTQAVDAFMVNHTGFENVFTDGSLTKFAKTRKADGLSSKAEYIRQNNLETVLQKAFLRVVTNKMGASMSDVLIGETRGNAFFEITLREFTYEGKCFGIGFQFQGKTMKLNIGGRPYGESTPDWLEPLRSSFETLVRDAKFERFNVGKKRGYLSGTRQLNNDVQHMELEELVTILSDNYKKAKIAADQWLIPKV